MIIATLTVLFFSFIFSGTEAAFLSLPAGEPLTPKAKQAKQAMRSTLCSLVLGNNLANIAGSIALGTLAAKELGAFGQSLFPWIFTLAVIVFGEIVPKALGEARPVTVIQLMAPALLCLNWCFAPVQGLFNFVLQFLPKKKVIEDEEELVEAARALDSTPVSELPMTKSSHENEEWEIPSVPASNIAWHTQMIDQVAPRLINGEELIVLNEEGVMGMIDKNSLLKWLFDHY